MRKAFREKFSALTLSFQRQTVHMVLTKCSVIAVSLAVATVVAWQGQALAHEETALDSERTDAFELEPDAPAEASADVDSAGEPEPVPATRYVEYLPGAITGYTASPVFDSPSQWVTADDRNAATNGVYAIDNPNTNLFYTTRGMGGPASSGEAGCLHYASAISPEAVAAATEAGYEFECWEAQYYGDCVRGDAGDYRYANAIGDRTEYAEGQQVVLDAHVQLVARWKKSDEVTKTVLLQPSAVMPLEGAALTEGQCEFTLFASDSTWESQIPLQTKSNASDGSIIFDAIPYVYSFSNGSGTLQRDTTQVARFTSDTDFTYTDYFVVKEVSHADQFDCSTAEQHITATIGYEKSTETFTASYEYTSEHPDFMNLPARSEKSAPGRVLPNTGGLGTAPYTITGAPLCVTALVTYGVSLRRKQRREVM